MHTYMHASKQSCMHANMHLYEQTYLQTWKYIQTHTCIHTAYYTLRTWKINMHPQTHIHTRAGARTHTRTHARTHTRTHAHTQTHTHNTNMASCINLQVDSFIETNWSNCSIRVCTQICNHPPCRGYARAHQKQNAHIYIHTSAYIYTYIDMLKLNVCVRVCGIYIYDTNMASCINLQSGFFHGSELIDFSVFVCTQICNHPPYVCLDMHTLTQTYMHRQTHTHAYTLKYTHMQFCSLRCHNLDNHRIHIT